MALLPGQDGANGGTKSADDQFKGAAGAYKEPVPVKQPTLVDNGKPEQPAATAADVASEFVSKELALAATDFLISAQNKKASDDKPAARKFSDALNKEAGVDQKVKDYFASVADKLEAGGNVVHTGTNMETAQKYLEAVIEGKGRLLKSGFNEVFAENSIQVRESGNDDKINSQGVKYSDGSRVRQLAQLNGIRDWVKDIEPVKATDLPKHQSGKVAAVTQ